MTNLNLPVLYSFRRCPYAMRARMGLWAAGIQYELREVLLRDKPQDMLELSPKGTVPVLHLPDGAVIDESLNVMRWALAQNDPRGWLAPENGTAEEMMAWVERCDSEFKHHLDRYKYATRYENCDPLEHRTAGETFLRDLDAQLHGLSYLFGDQPTMADIAIAPFVRQFGLTNWDWFYARPYPNLHRWLNAFIDTPPFTAVMDKFDPWQPGDAAIVMNA